MNVVVITGVPGSGKTYYRELHLGHFPHVDTKDVYDAVGDISWDAAVMAMLAKAEKLFRDGVDTVVLEGIFLEYMPSRVLLERELRNMRIDAQFIPVHRPYRDCREGVVSSSEGLEAEMRLNLLDIYFERAEGQNEERKRGNNY